MDQDTFTATIRALKNRKPFNPFTVMMVNGDRFEVDYPDALAVREGVALYIAPGKIPVFLDYDGVSHINGDLAGRGTDA